MRRVISTDDAPAAVGAYSQGTTTGELVFTAGQVALTPDGDFLEDASVAEQTERALENVLAVLDAAGADAGDVLKTTVFLADIEKFAEMNETYATYFGDEPPARSAIEVGALPLGAAVEIEAVACVPDAGSDSEPGADADGT